MTVPQALTRSIIAGTASLALALGSAAAAGAATSPGGVIPHDEAKGIGSEPFEIAYDSKHHHAY